MQASEIFTHAIFGAGAISSFAVFQLGLAKLRAHLVDILDNRDVHPDKLARFQYTLPRTNCNVL